MKIKTNSDVIRTSVLSSVKLLQGVISQNLKANNMKSDDFYGKLWLNNSLYERLTNSMGSYDLAQKCLKDEAAAKVNVVLMALEEITFLSDYYIFSTYKFKTQNEDNKDSTIEKALKSIRDKAFGYITESLDLVAMTDATKEIKNASFYKKIVIFNSLDKTDIEFLSSINPFFEEEYKLYGMNITPEFIVDEINQQNDTNLPNEAIYQELARLLADLYRIDEDLINDVTSDIIETLSMNGTDMDSLIALLDSNYTNDIDLVLASLIQQYYKIKKMKRNMKNKLGFQLIFIFPKVLKLRFLIQE